MLKNINRTAIEPALAILPARMKSKEALVMLYAIGLQESRFTYRRQIKGPARGFWQFERDGGTAGVLRHRSSQMYALAACKARGLTDLTESELIKGHVPSSIIERAYRAFEHDDVLAAVFARLLLWTDAKALPELGDAQGAWDLYMRTWRPGKPHRHTWDALYKQTLEEVERS